jgi:hypothetical protein
MSHPKVSPGADHALQIEVAQLRAQVRALVDLLAECGLVDRSMLEGRLSGAASRVAPKALGLPPAKKPGLLGRLFRQEPSEPSRPGRLADQTLPAVELPFQPVPLYGDSDLQTTDRRRLTPTEVGKCQRCWRMRPLSAGRLCARCDSR